MVWQLEDSRSHVTEHELSFFFSFLLRDPPTAYESSQARGQNRWQLPAYATATPDLSHVYELHHSSR